jgi:hypothetical protein
MIEVLGIKNANKLVPVEEDATPTDPVQENQNLLTGKPVKAFMEQNHQAHLGVHMAAMQDPKIMQIVGQNPQAQAIQAAMMAHINEHVAFEYRKQIEEKMGMILPGEDQQKHMSSEQADQIAIAAAQGAQALLQQNKQQAAAQQAQQQAQDPVVQMQQQELQLKQQEMQLKERKLMVDAGAKENQQQIEMARIAAQKEIAAMQVAANAAAKRDQLAKQQATEGARMGIDIAKSKAQMQQQRAQAHQNRMTQNRVPRDNKE